MSLIQWVAAWMFALQLAPPSGAPAKISNPLTDRYFIIAIVAVVLGLIIVVFIRSSCRGSSRR